MSGDGETEPSDAAELLELVEEALDTVAFFVEGRVVAGDGRAGAGEGDHRLGAGALDRGAEVVGVVAPVGQHPAGAQALDQGRGPADVALLAGTGQQPHRIAKPVGAGVDLGAQAAARAAQALGMRPPFCRGAPAACWCARTMVESTISHSRSASPLRAWKISAKTPRSIQS